MLKNINQSTLTWLCQILLAVLVIVMCVNVLLRFGFNAGSVKLQDFQSYVFAALIPLSIAFAFSGNKHIRAGVVKKADGKATQSLLTRWSEFALGLISFITILAYSLPGVVSSWAIFEGSTEPEGLGGYFLVRTTLPVVCFIILVILFRRHFSRNRGDA